MAYRFAIILQDEKKFASYFQKSRRGIGLRILKKLLFSSWWFDLQYLKKETSMLRDLFFVWYQFETFHLSQNFTFYIFPAVNYECVFVLMA